MQAVISDASRWNGTVGMGSPLAFAVSRISRRRELQNKNSHSEVPDGDPLGSDRKE
jgi:hypothetical protein